MKNISKNHFMSLIVLVLASGLFLSCGPKRERPVVSLKSLNFANGASLEQASVKTSDEAQLSPLLGTYQGSWSVMTQNGAYQISLSTEEVEIEETQAVYTFAKMSLSSGSIQLESYLAVQAGTVQASGIGGAVPAFAFSSTVLSHSLVAQNAFGIYLILSHSNGQFNTQNSAAYLLDCGTSYMNNGVCTSNSALSGAHFNAGINKIQ